MDAEVLAALRAHAAREAPRECCGLVIARAGGHEYRPCRNIAADGNQFAIDATELRAHDVILMRIRAEVPNHGAIYLGDNRILQHLMDKLSSRTMYGGWYQRCTTHILRHRQTSSR